jgi:hypothetical protein
MTIAVTHTVVKTRPADRRFGAGLLAFVPFAVTYPDHFEPSDADRRWAAAFARDDEPGYDLLANESAAIDAMSALTPPPAVESCRSCGRPAEVDRDGLCDACGRVAGEIGTATINRRFGLGNRAF